MSEEKKSNKRKLWARYIILAACILVIAAATVTVVFAANNWFKTDVNIDADGGNTADNNGGNQGGNGTGNGGNTGNNGGGGNGSSGGNNGNEEDKPTGGNADNNGNQGGNTADVGDDKPATSVTEFACPVDTVDVINVFDFCKDVTLGHYHFHTGLDMAGEVGASVIACLDGRVESIVVGDQLDGTTVTLAHDNGIKTVYSFIDAVEGLKAGDTVKRGEKIGTIAEPSGKEFKEGAHLHFEVYENGKLADPENFLDVSSK